MNEAYHIRMLRCPYFSEKVSYLMKRNNVVVFKVRKDATKITIKKIIYKFFNIKVLRVHIINVKDKGRYYRNKHRCMTRKFWKKAYITLRSGKELKMISENKELL
ncbi:MAG: 50S ribosomal subunit protein L23 [Candidatus Westeberhardia cardiocondylae]|nr:50S ribosomal subunit protein L23 [Candidatus Westeberhardia cardiocondylae]